MKLVRRSFFAALGGGALAACAPAASPTRAGGGWREVKTEHLTLTFSLAQDEAHRFGLLLEAIYQSIYDLGFAAGRRDGHVWVVLARDKAEYEAVLGKHTVGLFHAPGLGSRTGRKPAIAVMMTAPAGVRNVLAHELTHYLAHLAYGDGLPTWVNEGLAQYWSTIDVRDGVAYIGGRFTERQVDDGAPLPGPRTNSLVPLAKLVRPSELVRTDEHDFYDQGEAREERVRVVSLYLSSYLFVHLMLNGPEEYRARGAAFLKKLEGGTALASSAYASAFGDKDPAVIDADFIAWAKLRKRPVIERPYELRERAIVSERSLGPIDVAAAAAMLRGR